jgi:hypothetical protein
MSHHDDRESDHGDETASRTDEPSRDRGAVTIRTARELPALRTGALERVGLVTAGLVIGALLGAGLAMLLTPRTGAETRALVAKRARRARRDAVRAIDTVGDELRSAARKGRREVERAVRSARDSASDMLGR